MLIAQDWTKDNWVPSKLNDLRFSRIACWIWNTWVAMTDKTAGSIRLNSSKQHHEPLDARPLKNLAKPQLLPTTLVRSYRTVSSLPVKNLATLPSAVYFLLHVMSGFPDLALASTLSCEVPTFLSVAMRAPRHCAGFEPASEKPTSSVLHA